METMFNTLLQLPLFQGLQQDDFTSILEKVKLNFRKHKPGELLLRHGTPCNQLLFVLKGEVSRLTVHPDGIYAITEYIAAPSLVEPYTLFGMHTTYSSTYRATMPVDTVSISKSYLLKELFKYEIFRLNYLNIISNRSQTLQSRLWTHPVGDTPEARILSFIVNHLDYPAYGKKIVKIKMEVLAHLINEARISVSRTLNALQDEGLVQLRRGEIGIPDISKLAGR